MAERFFDVGKVGCYCETITHSTEKRKDGETKVITLSLRVDPFDAKLAAAVSQPVRQTLFKLNNPDPQDHLRKVHFALGVPRQKLTVWATPDSPKASFFLDQVLVGETYARTKKDAAGYVLVTRLTFGPASAKDLEFVERWRNSMMFVTFDEAEYDADLELEVTGDEDDDTPAPQPKLHEFDTESDGKPLSAADASKNGDGRKPRGPREVH